MLLPQLTSVTVERVESSTTEPVIGTVSRIRSISTAMFARILPGPASGDRRR